MLKADHFKEIGRRENNGYSCYNNDYEKAEYLPIGNVLEMEKQEWKPYRNALDKAERNLTNWGIFQNYISQLTRGAFSCPLYG